MPCYSEYDVRVRHFTSFPVALVGVALLASAPFAQSQSNGAATFPGAGHPATGALIPPTGPVIPRTGPVAPPTGIVPGANSWGYTSNAPSASSGTSHHHRHHNEGAYPFPFLYAVPVPYAVDPGAADNSDADDDEANYQGGPTVFDRRGYGVESYVPPMADSDDDSATRTEVTSSVPDAPQPATLLVFKDGHTVELGNYAIVGATLFDLTPGHTRKIALADIDLGATQRQNDDRGVSFAIPTSPQAD